MRFHKSLSVFFGVIILTYWVGSASAAPFYHVQGGELLGIRNIDIGGTVYDVDFRDGVFEDLFNLAGPFPFTTASGASDASQALSLVMNDVPQGDFDSDPLLTFGCAGDNCQMRTPYLFDSGFVSSEWFRNAALEVDDEKGSADFLPGFDSTSSAVVFADWTVVPEPATLLLLALGLGALWLSGYLKEKK